MNFKSIGQAVTTLGLIALVLVSAAEAAEKAARVGYVDVDQAAARSRSIQSSVKSAEDQLRLRQDEMDTMIREFRRMQEDLKARRSALSEGEIRTQEGRIGETRDKLDAMKLEIDKQLRRAETEIMAPAVDRILNAVREVGRREGFDLIIRADAVLYGVENADITPLVIEELDRGAAALKSGDESKGEAGPRKRTEKRQP